VAAGDLRCNLAMPMLNEIDSSKVELIPLEAVLA